MRVFLFLLLTTTIAAQPIRCSEERATNASVRYDPPYRLVRIPPPQTKGMTRTRFGDVTIYARNEKSTAVDWNGEIDIRHLNVIAERGGAWFQLLDENGGPPFIDQRWMTPETEAPPIITRAKRGLPIIRVTWVERWVGATRIGFTRHTTLLDFRGKPRVLLSIECSDAGGGGVCTAPDAAHFATETMTCDDDLRCTMGQSIALDWATRTATRTFDLLTGEKLPPSRFDLVTYASGSAFGAAAPASVRQRAMIETIGTVEPISEVSPDTVLFAAHARDPIVGVRFFLLRRGMWREIAATVLQDDTYPGPDAHEAGSSIGPEFTPAGPHLELSAVDLELPGNRKLIEVIATEGEARSIYWIMLDPNGRTGALRVATNQPEWRHCGDVVYPISASSLGIPDRGLPAFVTAIGSWRSRDGRDGKLPRTCPLTGTIDWNPNLGWIVRLGQAPCTDPSAEPIAVGIGEGGDLHTYRVSFSR